MATSQTRLGFVGSPSFSVLPAVEETHRSSSSVWPSGMHAAHTTQPHERQWCRRYPGSGPNRQSGLHSMQRSASASGIQRGRARACAVRFGSAARRLAPARSGTGGSPSDGRVPLLSIRASCVPPYSMHGPLANRDRGLSAARSIPRKPALISLSHPRVGRARVRVAVACRRQRRLRSLTLAHLARLGAAMSCSARQFPAATVRGTRPRGGSALSQVRHPRPAHTAAPAPHTSHRYRSNNDNEAPFTVRTVVRSTC